MNEVKEPDNYLTVIGGSKMTVNLFNTTNARGSVVGIQLCS